MNNPNHEQRYVQLQAQILAGITVGMVASAGSELINLSGGAEAVSLALSAITILGFLFAAWALIRTARASGRGDFQVLQNDELYADYRAKAFATGFGAMMVVLMLFLIGGDLLSKLTAVELNSSFVASSGIATGLIAALARFVLLSRSESSGE